MDENMKYIDYITEAKKYDKLIKNKECINIAILRSFTINNIEPIFKVEAYNNQIYMNLLIGEYNQYYQEVIDEKSKIYKFSPDIVIIAVRLEEMYPQLFSQYLSITTQLDSIELYIINQYKIIIDSLKKRSKCNIIINNFVLPLYSYSGLSDFQNIQGHINFIRKLNLELIKLIQNYNGVYIADIENIASILGKTNIYDAKMWYYAKNPYKYHFYVKMSEEYVKIINAIYRDRKKCVILDLDNTLWGGILGEDGIEGIKLGESYPGNCYKDFQKELLKLKNRGVILAICSKNNEDEVKEVFNKHPDMLLSMEDFVNVKINWSNKYSNIVNIANEINIGLDSIVFIDDSPVECELIKQKLPQIEVINLPKNPLEYVELINNLNCFDTLHITEEDLNKTNSYKAQRKREELKTNFDNIEDYYCSLDMKVRINEANKLSISRISQLTKKTNQFNLTTRRYTEEDVVRMVSSEDYKVYYIRVMDKFGDYGISGCCILKRLQNNFYIDTFLLSCRVMGRDIEKAFMALICKVAVQNNSNFLIGKYIPTTKNKAVEKFYENIGFIKVKDNEYTLNLINKIVKCPEYIKIVGE